MYIEKIGQLLLFDYYMCEWNITELIAQQRENIHFILFISLDVYPIFPQPADHDQSSLQIKQA